MRTMRQIRARPSDAGEPLELDFELDDDTALRRLRGFHEHNSGVCASRIFLPSY